MSINIKRISNNSNRNLILNKIIFVFCFVNSFHRWNHFKNLNLLSFLSPIGFVIRLWLGCLVKFKKNLSLSQTYATEKKTYSVFHKAAFQDHWLEIFDCLQNFSFWNVPLLTDQLISLAEKNWKTYIFSNRQTSKGNWDETEGEYNKNF